MMFEFERRWRDALMEALIPAASPVTSGAAMPGAAMPGAVTRSHATPAASELEWSPFWTQFERVAPSHLKLAFRVATCVVAGAVPRALGYRDSLDRLPTGDREHIITRAARVPLVRDLVEIAKVVACLGYFDAAEVQSAVRGEG